MNRPCRSIILCGFLLVVAAFTRAQSLHHAASGLLVPAAFQATENGPVNYVYDQLGRLVAVIGSSGDAAVYNYDAVGNILSIQRIAASEVSVISFTPAQGIQGASVTIYGTGFSTTASQNSVSFHGTAATVIAATSNTIVTSVPAGATTGTVSVTTPGGSASSSAAFTVQPNPAPPAITGFSPTLASQGATIAITGTNFDPVPQNDKLFMNVTPAPPSPSPAVTSTTMSAMIPPFTGSGHIKLATQAGTAVSSGDLFIPPPATTSPFTSNITFTGRTALNTPTTVTLGNNGQSLGLLLFDGVGGHTVSAYVTPVAGSSFIYQLYSPNNTYMDSVGSCNSPCLLVDQLPVSGTYTAGISYGSATVTVSDSTPITQSITANGSAATLNLGLGQNGQLTFAASAGQQATVQFSNNSIPDATVSLLSPDGTVVRTLRTTATSFSLPTAMLPQSGLHTIFIHPMNTSTGSVTVSLTLQGGNTAVPPRPSGSTANPSSPLYANLVGLFAMNEGSGTSETNLVDNQTAPFSGSAAPAWNTTDPSIVFNGGANLNSYVNAGTDLNFDQLPASKMTVVAKVYLNGLSAGAVGEKFHGGQGFSFYWNSSQALYFQMGSMYVGTANQALAANRWIQLAATWDGTLGGAVNAHIFVDGVEQTKAAVGDQSGRQPYFSATNQPLYIGSSSLANSSMTGKMAYFAVYRGRILSGAELNQLDSQLPLTSDVIGAITENGSAVSKTTAVAGQGVQLTFQGWYGQQATVQLSNNTMGAVTVNLVNPDGSILATISSSAASFNLPTATLPASGQFDVVVRPTGSTTGSITANLSVQGGFRPQGSTLDTSNSLSTNLAGLFPMNEGSGTTDVNLVDSQAASFSGSSLPTWNTTDPSVALGGGSSLNSYLNAGTDLIFDQLTLGKMTVVAKLYVTDPAPAGGIAEKNDGGSWYWYSGFSFGWNANGALNLTVEKSGGDMSVSTGNATIPYGKWVQVAFTWDGTVGNASAAHVFLNGVEQSKASSADGSGSIGYMGATNMPLRIGNASLGGASASLSGKMAYLAIYKGRILTTTEMNQLDAQLPIH